MRYSELIFQTKESQDNNSYTNMLGNLQEGENLRTTLTQNISIKNI